MTDPLSDADERAVQLMVGRIVGKGMAMETRRLRAALQEIRDSILEEAADTVWMLGGIETVVDYIDATLGIQPVPAATETQTKRTDPCPSTPHHR